ncbi:MAG: hypothetical protein HQK65_15700, partial [Desulfamplus sp.]|nr:hypothetical protein [Desulfamplus sp.]
MANVSITKKGIEQALSSLKYKDNSVKKRVVLAILQYYALDSALSQLKFIDTDELIKTIWNTGDDIAAIKAKRRNFYSIRSSINSDLANLSSEVENPEKITITSENIFDMTEEAKNNLLSSFSEVAKSGNLDLSQIAEVLSTITSLLSKIDINAESEDSKPSDTLDQIKNKLKSLSDYVLSDQAQDQTESAVLSNEEVIEIADDAVEDVEEIAEDQEIVEVEEDEALDPVEELGEDEELVEIEDDVVEDVEEIAEDEEIVEVEEDEAL